MSGRTGAAKERDPHVPRPLVKYHLILHPMLNNQSNQCPGLHKKTLSSVLHLDRQVELLSVWLEIKVWITGEGRDGKIDSRVIKS